MKNNQILPFVIQDLETLEGYVKTETINGKISESTGNDILRILRLNTPRPIELLDLIKE